MGFRLTALHETVSTLCAAYCARIDAAHPGVLLGLYLVGSIALDDYRPGASDVDFIAVLNRALGRDDTTALHESLSRQFSRPRFDGIYVDTDALMADPRTIAAGLSVVDGRVRGPDRDERHPVTWLTLSRHGVAIRGRAPSPDWVWSDVASAQQHARENLSAYWQPQLDWHRSQLEAQAPLSDEMFVWGALGVARLHETIATGRMPSKTAAAAHALIAFPGHVRIIREALNLRTNPAAASIYRSPLTRRRDLVAFMEAVIDAGA